MSIALTFVLVFAGLFSTIAFVAWLQLSGRIRVNPRYGWLPLSLVIPALSLIIFSNRNLYGKSTAQIYGGSGSLSISHYDVGDFDKIKLFDSNPEKYSHYTNTLLHIVQGEKDDVTIETDNNFSNWVQPRVENGVLMLDLSRIQSYSPTLLDITVNVRNLHVLDLWYAGIVESTPITTDDFKLISTGSHKVKLDIVANNLSVESSSDDRGQIEISGKATNQEIYIKTGDYDASNLQSIYTKVDVDAKWAVDYGSSRYLPHLIINARDRLDANIVAAGMVEYYGSPDISSSHVTGRGMLRHLAL